MGCWLGLLLWLVIAFVGGTHSAAGKVFRLSYDLIAKVFALFVEKSLSGRHNRRLDNVLGQ